MGGEPVGRLVFNDEGTREEFVTYSIINVADIGRRFSPVVYQAKDFPFQRDASIHGLLDGLHEWRTHFLSLCAQVWRQRLTVECLAAFYKLQRSKSFKLALAKSSRA